MAYIEQPGIYQNTNGGSLPDLSVIGYASCWSERTCPNCEAKKYSGHLQLKIVED